MRIDEFATNYIYGYKDFKEQSKRIKNHCISLQV